MKQLSYVVAAAQYGSVTRAAKALHISQPSISMAIAMLERELQQILFIRHRGSGTTVTPAGERFVGRARALLAEFSELHDMPAEHGRISGSVVLDCFADLAPFCAPAIISRLRVRHPEVSVVVNEFDLAAVGRRLRSGASDVAITYELGLPQGLAVETLQSVLPHALLAADDPLARRKRVELASVCEAPLILTREFLSLQHFFELLRSQSVSPIHTVEAGSFEMQRSMVANGLGRAIVYTQSYSNTTHDGKVVVRRALVEKLTAHPIVLASAPSGRVSRAVDAFATEARHYFKTLRT